MQANSAVLAAATKAVTAYGAYCDKSKRGYDRHENAGMIEMFEDDKDDATCLLNELKANKDFTAFINGVYDLDTAAREELVECLGKAGLGRAIAYVYGDYYDPDDDPMASGKSIDFLPPPTIKKGQIWADLNPKRTKKIRTLQVETPNTKKASPKCRVFEDGKDTGKVVTVKVDDFRPERDKYRLLDVVDLFRDLRNMRNQIKECQQAVNVARAQLSTASSIVEDITEELDSE